MIRRGQKDNQRGFSEILGSIIVISLTVFVAIMLVTMGGVIVDQLQSESEETQVEMAFQEMDDRLTALSQSPVDTATTFSVPSEDAQAMPGEGNVTIRVESRMDAEEVRSDGGVCAVDGSESVDLGTIRYERGNGDRVIYQGGAIFSMSGGEMTVEANPEFDFDGTEIDFTFIDLSTVRTLAGQEVTAQFDAEGARNSTDRIHSEIAPCWQVTTNGTGGNDVVGSAPVDINVTFHTQYAEGWANYASEQMTVPLDEEDIHLDDNRVTLEFDAVGGEFQRNSTSGEFEKHVLYSGMSQYAQFNNETESHDGGPAFAVQEDHTLAVRERPSGGSWAIWDGAPGANVSDTSNWNFHGGDQFDPPVVDIWEENGETVYQFETSEVLCAVGGPSGGQSINGMISNGACTEHLVGTEEGEEVDEQFDIGVENFDANVDAGEELAVDVNVTNTGAGNGQQYISLLYDDGGEGIVLDYKNDTGERIELDSGESTTETLIWNTTAQDDGTHTLVAATEDVGKQISVTVDSVDQAVFNVTADQAASDDSVQAGEQLNVTVDIENDDVGAGTQWIVLENPNGTVVDATEVTLLDGTDTARETLRWQTTSGDVVANGDLTVRGEDDTATHTATVTGTPGDGGSDFQIDVRGSTDDRVIAGDTLTASLDVENTGNETGTQYVYIEDPGGTVVDAEQLTVQDGDSTTVDLKWETNPTDVGDSTIRVETEDDSATHAVAVESQAEDSEEPNFELAMGDLPDDVVVGETVAVNITVENTGDGTGTQSITLLDDDDRPISVQDQVLAAGATASLTVEWVPDETVGGSDVTLEATSEDDSVSASVPVLKEQNPEFDVTIQDVDDPVVAGERLNVTVDIENVGSVQGTDTVALEDVEDGIVDVTSVELGPGNSTERTLTWQDPQDLDPTDQNEIAVASSDRTASTNITVASQLLIQETNVSSVSSSSVTVNVTVANDGEQDLSDPVVLKDYDGTEVDNQTLSVDAGETGSLSLEWGEDPGRTGEVTVRTPDDKQSEQVVVVRDGPNCGAVTYEGSGTDSDPYEIETVDQLQCIDSDHQNASSRSDSLDAHYELVDDIDASGTENWNSGDGFEPIADDRNGQEFGGSFDGQGHEIRGLYIDRPDEAFVGLFAITNFFDAGGSRDVGEGAPIENVRLENVSIHGEQVTGAAVGAAGGPVENVRVSGEVTAEYAEVGGLVGSSHNADLDNRLVSEATVTGGFPAKAVDGVSHPWGADNMGIGGIVGSTGYNTEVSVAYSTANVTGPFAVGGIVGWTSDFASANEQMYWAGGNITITATQEEIKDKQQKINRYDYPNQKNTGGAIFGRGDDDSDSFADSVYINTDSHPHGFGEHSNADNINVIERTTSEMQGLNVTQSDRLGNLSFGESGDWVAVPEAYPRFEWELVAEGDFIVSIDDHDDTVAAGEKMTVDVTVESTIPVEESQIIVLRDPEGNPVDTQEVTLEADLQKTDETTITLEWEPDARAIGSNEITVESRDSASTATVDVTGDSGTVPSQFDVADFQAPDSVRAGSALPVDAEIHNKGSVSDSQIVYLTDTDDNFVDGTEVTDLGPDESTNVSLAWDTSVSDGGHSGTVEVHTEDHSQVHPVDVNEKDEDESVFEVTSLSTNDPDAGETLTVDAVIDNTGDEGVQVVYLTRNGNVVDSETVSLSDGGSDTVTLDWTTDENDTGTHTILVSTANDENSTTVDIQQPDDQEPRDFDVDIDEGASTTSAVVGDTVTVETQLSNGASSTDTQYVRLVDTNGNVLDIQELTLKNGSSTTETFTWTPENTYSGPLSVESQSANNTDSVQVDVGNPGEDSFYDVGIESAPDSVAVGEELSVTAELENTGTEADTQFIEMSIGGDTVDLVEVTLSQNEQTEKTLTWQVEGISDETVAVEIASEDDQQATGVTVDGLEQAEASAITGTPDPVDVSLGKIEIET